MINFCLSWTVMHVTSAARYVNCSETIISLWRDYQHTQVMVCNITQIRSTYLTSHTISRNFVNVRCSWFWMGSLSKVARLEVSTTTGATLTSNNVLSALQKREERRVAQQECRVQAQQLRPQRATEI